MVVALDEVAHDAGFYAGHFEESSVTDYVIDVEVSGKKRRRMMLCERLELNQ